MNLVACVFCSFLFLDSRVRLTLGGKNGVWMKIYILASYYFCRSRRCHYLHASPDRLFGENRWLHRSCKRVRVVYLWLWVGYYISSKCANIWQELELFSMHKYMSWHLVRGLATSWHIRVSEDRFNRLLWGWWTRLGIWDQIAKPIAARNIYQFNSVLILSDHYKFSFRNVASYMFLKT